MRQENDDNLIERAVAGDARALEQLFRRYYGTMNRFAQKICGNGPDADDVTQEAFIRLMGSIQTYDGRAAFSSWLYRVVLTKAIDHRRKEARRARLIEEVGLLSALMSAGMEFPEQELAVLAREVWDLILEFPAKERDALILVLGEGLTQRQAAEVLGCPAGTVGWLVSKATKRLNETLKSHDDRQEASQSDPAECEYGASVASG